MLSLRIAYVLINANRREGTSRAVVEVAERLAKKHDVTLFSRTAVDIDLSNICLHRIRCPAWPDVAEFVTFRMGVWLALKRNSFDIIHSAGSNYSEADVYAIQTVHPAKLQAVDPIDRNKGVGILRRLTRNLYDRCVIRSEQASYRCSNTRDRVGYLPVSSGTEQELSKIYPVGDAFVQVIPNGADTERFHPRNKHTTGKHLRSQIGYGVDDVVFLFTGGEWKRKGLELALRSLTQTTNPRIRLLVVGTDPQSDYFQQLANRLGVSDKVHWAGFRKDIEACYAAADVFFFPSSYEAFSLATIEAAASGLPILMRKISGAAELIGDGRGGLILPEDASQIALLLDNISSNNDRRIQLGNEARQKVESQFTWDLIADQSEQFYRKLLSSRLSAPRKNGN